MKEKVNLHQLAAAKAQAKIVKAAKSLFLERGFSGVSIAAIAKAASVNPSLLYHYFESKEDLWKQVKAEMITAILDEEDLTKAPPVETVDELLNHLVTRRLQLFFHNPDFVKLMLWQTVEEDSKEIASIQWMHSWLKVISSLQKRGVINRDYSPQEILILINGIVFAPFVSQPFPELTKSGRSYAKKIVKTLKILLTQQDT